MASLRTSTSLCIFLFASAPLFFVDTGCAQVPTASNDLPSRIDSILHAQFAPGGPGYAILIARGGETIYENASGYANLELDTPLRTDHVFRVASLTKQFTAVAILQLVEQNKVDLQGNITRFFPDFPQRGITVEHLLTHTSGIPDFTKMPSFTAEIARQGLTVKQQIEWFKHEPLDFEPGSAYGYSNSGYALLGRIIEVVSGLSYAAYMKQFIFDPLGLDQTYYNQDATIIPGRAQGYSQSDGSYINAAYVNDMLPYASGALLSTIGDLYTWNQALVSGEVVNSALLTQAQSPYTLRDGTNNGYGYGWGLGILNDQPVVSHSGAINGFLSDALYFPEIDVFIVVLTNCDCNPPAPAIMQIVPLLF